MSQKPLSVVLSSKEEKAELMTETILPALYPAEHTWVTTCNRWNPIRSLCSGHESQPIQYVPGWQDPLAYESNGNIRSMKYTQRWL